MSDEVGTPGLPRHLVRHARRVPEAGAGWDAPAWRAAAEAAVACFRPEGSGHRPRTLLRLLHDGAAIHGIFRVEDRYVRCVHAGHQAQAWRDSCVEIFLQPPGAAGYFAFEFGCGGALRAAWITDHRRTPEGFREFALLTEKEVREIAIAPSLPARVDPERAGPVTWTLGFSLPFALLERRAGRIDPAAGQPWRGNFFKCGDETSHPHWASWAPLPERNFHLPECFGVLEFQAAMEPDV